MYLSGLRVRLNLEFKPHQGAPPMETFVRILPNPTTIPIDVDLKPPSYATAGQQAAGNALREAIENHHAVVLVFGETGVGKSMLIRSMLASGDKQREVTLCLSATASEFVDPPTFDSFLDIICQRITDGQQVGQRPAVLAALTAAVASFARAQRTLVLAIDQADHVTDRVISELIKLSEYLDAAPGSLVLIFIGSSGLASRLDSVLRRQGAGHRRFAEIRVSQPTAEEVATLLAYEDMAQSGGPMLTPGAIDRIAAYAKTNMHWALSLADAARALALHDGKREVTPELVGGALLELWPPGQKQADVSADTRQENSQGLSDISIARISSDGASARTVPPSPQVDQNGKPAGTRDHKLSKVRGLRWLIAASVLAFIIGIAFLRDNTGTTLKEPVVGVERGTSTEPEGQQPVQQALGEREGDGSAQELGTGGSTPPLDETSPGGTPDEQPAMAPIASPAPRPVTSALPTNAKEPLIKKVAPNKGVRKPRENQSNPWIQRR